MTKLANKKIAVLAGGPGSEREVSLRSGASVAAALAQAGALPEIIDVRDENFTIAPDVDMAFNMIHGTFGEDGRLQSILEERGIPYTGEGVETSRLAFDKILSKRRFEHHHVSTPRYEVLRAGDSPTLPLPIVVKAPREGSSVGVYLVRAEAEIAPALQGAAQFADDLLIEELIDGQELTVGLLGDEALPIIMIKPKDGFYDFKNKYPWLNPSGAADHYCPAPLSDHVTAHVQALALDASRALGIQTYCRVDILLDKQDRAFVLEVNTIPGMTDSSLLPEAAKVAGIDFPRLCERIAELSLARPKAN
jgi:D-alanine-D-alanine ligase